MKHKLFKEYVEMLERRCHLIPLIHLIAVIFQQNEKLDKLRTFDCVTRWDQDLSLTPTKKKTRKLQCHIKN